jgi:hypothetical protein
MGAALQAYAWWHRCGAAQQQQQQQHWSQQAWSVSSHSTQKQQYGIALAPHSAYVWHGCRQYSFCLYLLQHRWLSDEELDEIMSLYDTTNRCAVTQ